MPKSLILKQAGAVSDNLAIEEVEKPTPASGQVLIKTHSVAINPADWKIAKYGVFVQSFPSRMGFDVSGTIEDLGSNTESYGLKKGDEIFGRSQMDAFGEYCLADIKQIHKKPSNLSFEQASTLGVGLSTAIGSLFSEKGLRLARPNEHRSWFRPEWVIIWGGSSSVGAYAVQLAAAAGYSVISTASPKNFEYVQSLGAVHVLDYKSPTVVDEIKSLTGGRVRIGFDAIGGDATGALAKCLVADSARPSTILSIATMPDQASLPDGVTLKWITGADPELNEYVFGVVNEEMLEYLEQGRISTNKVRLVDGGLEGVKQGLELSAGGKVSGEKLVVNIV